MREYNEKAAHTEATRRLGLNCIVLPFCPSNWLDIQLGIFFLDIESKVPAYAVRCDRAVSQSPLRYGKLLAE